MKTIERVWKETGLKKGSRVRFLLWNWKHKYFEIDGYSKCNKYIVGKLDCGEEITFAKNSLHWGEYNEGDEAQARAV